MVVNIAFDCAATGSQTVRTAISDRLLPRAFQRFIGRGGVYGYLVVNIGILGVRKKSDSQYIYGYISVTAI